MAALDDAPQIQFPDRASWRAWLEANHATATGVWFVTWRSGSGRASPHYESMIEEALCFGWVDGTAGTVDDERGKLYFAARKPRSGWAQTNKARVERLIAQGRMQPAGLAAIERAKANGSWSMFDEAERLEVPVDLAAAFDERPSARANFEAWPPSVRKMQLAHVATARRPETRAARIRRIADAAASNERPR